MTLSSCSLMSSALTSTLFMRGWPLPGLDDPLLLLLGVIRTHLNFVHERLCRVSESCRVLLQGFLGGLLPLGSLLGEVKVGGDAGQQHPVRNTRPNTLYFRWKCGCCQFCIIVH